MKHESKHTPTKRHAPITFDFDKGGSGNKQRKNTENVKIYTPPSGKFSNNFQNQSKYIIIKLWWVATTNY